MINSIVRKLRNYSEGRSKIHQVGLSCNPLPPVGYGGIETIITNLTRGLVAQGIPVVCYSPLPFGIQGAKHYPTLSEVSSGPKEKNIANIPRHLAKIIEGLNENWRRGDIIHLHHFQHYPYIGSNFKKFSLLRPNFIETAHWTRVALKKNIVYPCSPLKEAIGRKGKVIPHGIDLSLFKPKLNQGSYLFYAGRVTEDKGVHIGAEAAKEYGVEFRVAGPIIDKEYAATFMESVNYIGELEGDALVPQYQNALALVYMTQYIEPFGLSVVESMACGTPVITTGKGGTGETVVEGKTGFFCQTKEDILKALDKIGQIKREACIERAQLYSIENMTKGYMDFYREISI